MHHYKIDKNGLITWVNMIIATGHNNLAMNQSVKQVAQHFVKADKLQEGMLNRVEAVIRSLRSLPELFDPCGRPDAAARSVARAGRQGIGRNQTIKKANSL